MPRFTFYTCAILAWAVFCNIAYQNVYACGSVWMATLLIGLASIPHVAIIYWSLFWRFPAQFWQDENPENEALNEDENEALNENEDETLNEDDPNSESYIRVCDVRGLRPNGKAITPNYAKKSLAKSLGDAVISGNNNTKFVTRKSLEDLGFSNITTITNNNNGIN